MVLVMLPIFDNEASTRLKNEKGVELTDALGAAAGAISYVGSMCSEKPDVCVKGAETFSTLGSRAREGARVAYTYLDDQFADEDKTKVADAVLTGSTVLTGSVAASDVTTSDNMIRNIPIPVPRPRS